MIETTSLEVGTNLINRGLLDVTLNDLAYNEREGSFLNKSISQWDQSTSVEMHVVGSTVGVLRHAPLRTNIRVLKRLYKSAKSGCRNAFNDISYLYQVGFVVPKSSILSQAWKIFFCGQTPEIGGRSIEMTELLEMFKAHSHEAYIQSSNKFHLYPTSYYQNLDRYASTMSGDDTGFIAYRYNSKSCKYELCDAYLKDPKSGNLVNVYGMVTKLVDSRNVPANIGSFNVSDRSARIVVPFTCEYPKLSSDDWKYIRRSNIFEVRAFAPTKTRAEQNADNIRSGMDDAFTWIDSTFQLVISEEVNSLVKSRMDEDGYDEKTIRRQRRDRIKDAKADAKYLRRERRKLVKGNSKRLTEKREEREILVLKIRKVLQKFAARRKDLAARGKKKSLAKLAIRFKQTNKEYIDVLTKFDAEYQALLEKCELRLAEFDAEVEENRAAHEEKAQQFENAVVALRARYSAKALADVQADISHLLDAAAPVDPFVAAASADRDNKLKRREFRELKRKLKSEGKDPKSVKEPTYAEVPTEDELKAMMSKFRKRRLKFYRQRLKFIAAQTSTAYSNSIAMVDAREASNKESTKRNNLRLREIAEELEATDSEKKTVKLEAEKTKLKARTAKYKDALVRDQEVRDLHRQRMEESRSFASVLKAVKEYGEDLFKKREKYRPKNPSQMFELYATSLHCVGATKSSKLKKNVEKRLSHVGFKLKTVK